jgi:hypothetical protein
MSNQILKSLIENMIGNYLEESEKKIEHHMKMEKIHRDFANKKSAATDEYKTHAARHGETRLSDRQGDIRADRGVASFHNEVADRHKKAAESYKSKSPKKAQHSKEANAGTSDARHRFGYDHDKKQFQNHLKSYT